MESENSLDLRQSTVFYGNKNNIEYALNTIEMTFKRLSNINSRIHYWIACHVLGYCPTLKEIQSDDIKKIARRLKANSDKETLTNILAWQDDNISYWDGRWTLPIMFWVSLAFAGLSFSLALFLNPVICILTFFSLVGCAVAVFVIIALLVRSRKIPILSGLDNSFACSISMDFLLKNRLAICRDYAKLTACLLSNDYHEKEIYFASAFQHVATGIVIENKLYVLDKWLPVVTLDKWRERWKSKKPLKRLSGNRLESVEMDSFLSAVKPSSPDTEKKLATEVSKLLNIVEQVGNTDLPSLEIPWKKGWRLYEDNEIVNYSLSQLIKQKILKERLGLSQITKLEVIRDKDDLVFRIKFMQKKE